MPEPLPPKRKKPKAFLILIIALLAGGIGWYFWDKNEDQPRTERLVELKKFKAERPLMGTLATITIFAESSEQANSAFEAAFARGEEINQVASDYLPNSELTLFNTAQVDEWQDTSNDLLTMVSYGLELAELTEGSYDPTLGTMTHLWRETKKARKLPKAATIDSARALAGWELIEADFENHRLRKRKDGVRLDLGGLAKGYASDVMLEALNKQGIQRALVAVGGDIRCGDAPPEEEGWTVGLKDKNNNLVSTILVKNSAVSTSGDLEQFVEINNRRYSHIIDPASGLGLTDSLLATVVAPNGLMADPLGTAACVNPRFFSNLPASIEIHSRILSSEKEQISKGFPNLTPYLLSP